MNEPNEVARLREALRLIEGVSDLPAEDFEPAEHAELMRFKLNNINAAAREALAPFAVIKEGA